MPCAALVSETAAEAPMVIRFLASYHPAPRNSAARLSSSGNVEGYRVLRPKGVCFGEAKADARNRGVQHSVAVSSIRLRLAYVPGRPRIMVRGTVGLTVRWTCVLGSRPGEFSRPSPMAPLAGVTAPAARRHPVAFPAASGRSRTDPCNTLPSTSPLLYSLSQSDSHGPMKAERKGGSRRTPGPRALAHGRWRPIG